MDTIEVTIKTKEGRISLFVPNDKELTWKNITSVYIQALNGLGYTLPKEFEELVFGNISD